MMRNTKILLLGLWLGLMTMPAQSQPLTQITLGTTTVDAPAFQMIGNTITLFGGVVVTSPDYGLKARQVVIQTIPGKSGTAAIAQVTATGDSTHGGQVTGHFTQTAQGRFYTMRADRAVYTPDPARPGYGKIDFTGHPVITVRDPAALAVPAVTIATQITVILGKGPNYPQIDGNNGHITFTPKK